MSGEITKTTAELLKFLPQLFKSKSKGITKHKLTNELIQQTHDIPHYYKTLVIHYFVEQDFYLKTGIQTNFNSIEKYYLFKDKLGKKLYLERY